MITEAIIWVFSTVGAFLVGLIPSWTAPDWLVTVTATFANAVGYIGMLSGWFNVSAIGVVVGFILACSVVAFAIKAGRMALSLFTGGGGSAA